MANDWYAANRMTSTPARFSSSSFLSSISSEFAPQKPLTSDADARAQSFTPTQWTGNEASTGVGSAVGLASGGFAAGRVARSPTDAGRYGSCAVSRAAAQVATPSIVVIEHAPSMASATRLLATPRTVRAHD